jgi:hypothetical protein
MEVEAETEAAIIGRWAFFRLNPGDCTENTVEKGGKALKI